MGYISASLGIVHSAHEEKALIVSTDILASVLPPCVLAAPLLGKEAGNLFCCSLALHLIEWNRRLDSLATLGVLALIRISRLLVRRLTAYASHPLI